MERQKIIKGSAFLAISGYLSGILWYMFFFLAARKLGVETFGQLMFALTFVSLFHFTMDIGLSQFSQREIARRPEVVNDYFYNVLGLKSLLFLLSICIIAAMINILDYPDIVRKAVYILAAAEGLNSFSDFFRSIFRANHRVQFEAVIWIAERTLVLLLGIIVFYMTGDLVYVSLILLFTASLKFVAAFVLAQKKFVTCRKGISLSFWRESAAKAVPIGLVYMFGLLYFKIDTVMLSQMAGDRSVGLYNASYKLLEGAMMLSTSLAGVLYPSFSSLYEENRERFLSVSRTSIKYMLMVSLPLAAFVSLTSTEIISFLYGQAYHSGAHSLRILIWTFLFQSVGMVATVILIAIGQERRLLFILLLTLGLNIALNLVLIPVLQEVGAAVATVISEAVLTLFSFYALAALGIRLSLPDSITRIIIAVSILALLNLVTVKMLPLPLLMLMLAVAYIVICTATKLISVEDVRSIFLKSRENSISGASL